MHSDDVALFQSRTEILHVEGRLDGIDVPAQLAARKCQREVHRSAARWINGIVNAVVGVGRGHGAGADPGQLVGPAHSFEIDVIEIIAGRGGQRLEVGNVVAVGQPQTGEAALQRIRYEDRAAVAVLYIVQQVLRAQRIVIGNQVGSGE